MGELPASWAESAVGDIVAAGKHVGVAVDSLNG